MTGAANETRGEVALSLEGIDYVMRPSWEAIDAIEAKLAKSIDELAGMAAESARAVLAGRAPSSGLTREQKAVIACEFIRAWGRETNDRTAAAFNDRGVREVLASEDQQLVTLRLASVLIAATTGGVTSTGEAKPAAMTANPPLADAGSLA